MKLIVQISFCVILFSACSQGEEKVSGTKHQKGARVIFNGLESFRDTSLAPFYHGLASGDPLPTAVIIWTRITPEFHQPVEVFWEMYADAEMKKIVQTGKTTTNAECDYTVKVDVTGLEPAKYYYYRFKAFGIISKLARTKTAPVKEVKHLRLAFASCSNYAWGYFNAYKLMSQDTLDAVIHLGDYIYEHEQNVYESNLIDRKHLPNKEILALKDYRTRYAQYRLDKDLQAAHENHPFITVWDDHELANNAYDEGAGNHQENEGDWKTRLAIAKKVYYEWMPVREENNTLYRSFTYGDLAELIMLDTRTEGRNKQVSMNEKSVNDTSRKIINQKHYNWVVNELQKPVKWKLIGNQVLMGSLNIFFSKVSQKYDDGWDDYPYQQQKLMKVVNEIPNILFLTGDFHSSFYLQNIYKGKFASNEIVVPSITSANYDEDLGLDSAKIYTKWYTNANTNLKYVNLIDHGYLVLDINEKRIKPMFKFVDNVIKPEFNWMQVELKSIPLNDSYSYPSKR
jgi:alkaline phosphatase D